jgi:hypothetical protein
MEGKQSQFHIKNAVSVKEIGYHEDKNYPSRMNMEDCTPLPTQTPCAMTTSHPTARDSSASSMDTVAVRSQSTPHRCSLM